MILLDLFDTAVNTETVVLMYHIISYRQLRKAADLFAFVIMFLPLLLSLFRTEHVTLGDHHELDERIFKTFAEFSVGNQDLSRTHRTSRILRTKRSQIIFS